MRNDQYWHTDTNWILINNTEYLSLHCRDMGGGGAVILEGSFFCLSATENH